ncbi:MAG: hypothetical protein JWM59_3343 [Verrucomicrobiales bacterium]|nr:hypothetical protein [Verrucomicrobiales bacterium]
MKSSLSFAPALALAIALFSGCSLSTVRAQENERTAPPGNIQVQTTVFKVTGPALPLTLLHEAPDSDEALFIRLAGMVSDGGAELTADQHYTIPASTGAEVFGGQSLESVKETPYPSEYTLQRGGLEMVPQSFEFRNCGLAVGAEFKLLPRNPGNPASSGVLGSLSVESIRSDRIRSLPVSLPSVSVSATGSLDGPQFLTEKTHALFKSTDARHHLISVVRRAGETLEKNDEYCLTFAKAAPEMGKPAAKSGRGTALRLHAITFRLPTADGRHLLDLRQQSGDDHALLDSLLQASATQKAVLHDHSILRVEPSQAAPAPKPNDPFASATTTASLETIEEFMYATEHSDFLTPKSFEFKNLGRTFEVTADKPNASGLTRLRIGLQSYAAPEIFSWPESPENGGPGAQVHCPSFPVLKLSAVLNVRPGGAYCLGAVTLPSFFKDQHSEQSVMQISLLKVVGAGGDSSTQHKSAAGAQPELSSEIISLTPGDAAKLKILRDSPVQAKALLERLTEEGTAHSLAYLQIAGDAASRPEILAGVETPIPLGSLRTAAGLLLPTEFEIYSLNNSLALLPAGEPGFESDPLSNSPDFLPAGEPGKGKLQLRLAHTNATLTQPTLLQLEKAAAGDGTLPRPERFVNEASPAFSPRPFQILSSEPAKAPSGHPEQGRWHVTILRCTAQ